jgi:uncharacterized protein YndB with AHSA1/START domain
MSDPTPQSGVVSAHSDAEGIEIVREFDAPRELVFKAFVEPERFAAWFGEHDSEVPIDRISMDPRPGGKWNLTMLVGPDKQELPFGGEFVEVVQPERVSMTLTLGPDDPAETLTAVLEDLGNGRTRMVFTQRGGNLPPDEYSRALRGELIFLDRLAEHLGESLKARHDQDD